MKYAVLVPEIWNSWYLVEAENEDQARENVKNGQGEPLREIETSYSDTLDDRYETWLVLPHNELKA